MTFLEYVQAKKGDGSANKVVTALAKKAGVSKATLYNVLKGMKIKTYTKALALSKATGGKVKVRDLVESG